MTSIASLLSARRFSLSRSLLTIFVTFALIMNLAVRAHSALPTPAPMTHLYFGQDAIGNPEINYILANDGTVAFTNIAPVAPGSFTRLEMRHTR